MTPFHAPERRAATLALLAATIALGSCSDGAAPIACTLEARPSVTATILDSVTRAGRAIGSSLVLQDGAYVDSTFSSGVAPWSHDSLFGPTRTFERAGTYDVRVRRSGYQLWERRGVVVTQGVCHVGTVSLVVLLQASP